MNLSEWSFKKGGWGGRYINVSTVVDPNAPAA